MIFHDGELTADEATISYDDNVLAPFIFYIFNFETI